MKKKRSNAKRDYKKEYARDQSSTKRKKYRAELTRYRRKNKGGKGKDAIHVGGKIVGYGSRSKNRAAGARNATKSRIRNKKR
jgi:hypothetical protein